MPSGIDHVVIAVPDPDTAAAELTEAVGIAFTAGGRHEGLGTSTASRSWATPTSSCWIPARPV